MAEETITQTPPAEAPKETSRAEERITQLSDKVKEEATARKAAEDKAAALEKKAAFAEGFVDVMASNPAAKEFKADIEAKVMSGYTVEDAALAVLAKAGKLGNQTHSPQVQSPAGGSATTVTPNSGEKPVGEMSLQEKRDILAKELLWS